MFTLLIKECEKPLPVKAGGFHDVFPDEGVLLLQCVTDDAMPPPSSLGQAMQAKEGEASWHSLIRLTFLFAKSGKETKLTLAFSVPSTKKSLEAPVTALGVARDFR